MAFKKHSLRYRLLVSPFTIIILVVVMIATIAILPCCNTKNSPDDQRFVSYTADLKNEDIAFYWKNDKGERFANFLQLKSWLESKGHTLLFATNGGMYKPDHSPLGLYIDNNVTVSPLDTSTGEGNFYLQPNGVFYITTKNVAHVSSTTEFIDSGQVQFATQSGPMLVIKGSIHPAFQTGSANLNIRNGVGILPDKRIVFAMSKKEISLYEFAAYFKTLGCRNALYLDGFVSRTYLPAKNWIQTDGDFGVIIGITNNTNVLKPE